MKALLTGTTSSAITAGTTQYEPFMTQASTNSWSSSLTASTQTPVPHALTLDHLRVKVATAPGVGKNLVIVVLKNGVASGLTCTISGTNTTAQDLTHTVSYAAGDTITLQATLDTGGTAFGTIYWTARQDASGAFAMLGAVTSASAGFYPVMGSIGSAGTSGDTGVIMPCAGTIQNIFVNSSASAGNFTVYLNAVAQTLTTGSMGAATGNDTTHSFSVAAGDRVLVRNTGTARVSSWGVSFLPTTDGQSFVGAVSNGNVSTSSTVYMPTVNVSGSPSTTESWGMLQACTLLGLFAQTSVSPGVSPKAYTFTARQNSSNTAATFAINDASSTPNDATSGRAGNITGQSIAISDDDLISTSIVPASTPIGLHVYISILISISSGVTTTQTITGVARIQQTVQKTLAGVSRITVTTLQTITGKSRITATAQKTLTGIARITATTARTITGKSSILRTAQQTITGVSRIQISSSRTITGTARLSIGANQTITGKSRIQVTSTQTIQGKADIQKSTARTITGVSRVQRTVLQTITGVSRVTQIVLRTITGVARIQITTSRTITGKAAIKRTTSQTITGVAKIGNTSTQTITGRARLQKTATQTIQGVARLLRIVPQTITGKARIQKSAQQTITGVSRIQISSSKIITGQSRISRIVPQTLQGVSRITITTQQQLQGVALIHNAFTTQQRTITGVAHICVDQWESSSAPIWQISDLPAWAQAQAAPWYTQSQPAWEQQNTESPFVKC